LGVARKKAVRQQPVLAALLRGIIGAVIKLTTLTQTFQNGAKGAGLAIPTLELERTITS
jgi:hypothetical protein